MQSESNHKLGIFSATALVIANIIGTGIFTTTGFQAYFMKSPTAILVIWIVGGLLALCGALTYGELASAMPDSGGEYRYLSRIYHPVVGFCSGFISLFAGFAAPVAASATAFGLYFSKIVPSISPTVAAAGLVILVTILHSRDLKTGSRFQDFFTVLKATLIVGFILAGFWIGKDVGTTFSNDEKSWQTVWSPTFAVSLIYVSFAYSGWNAAAYISGEISNPQKNVPLALLLGTLTVIGLYLGVNLVFLRVIPFEEIANSPTGPVVEIGHLAATHVFGVVGGEIVSGLISLALVSSVSAMIMAGPRIIAAIGDDMPAMRFLSIRNSKGVPVSALWIQSSLSLLMVFTATFESILAYIGFTLSIFAFLAVSGVYLLRFRNIKAAVRTPGYPVTPALFVLLSLWMVLNTVQEKPIVSLAGLGTIAFGAILYSIGKRTQN